MVTSVSMSSPVSFICSVMAAFSCRPKVSGVSSSGRPSMYLRTSAVAGASGA